MLRRNELGADVVVGGSLGIVETDRGVGRTSSSFGTYALVFETVGHQSPVDPPVES